MKNLYLTLLFLTVLLFAGKVNAQYELHYYDKQAAIHAEKADVSGTLIKKTVAKTEENPFNFEITYNNMQVMLDLQNAISIAQQKAVDDWLKKQEANFLKEINRQLGTNHTNFGTAQKDFFKNYEKNLRRVETNARSVAYSHTKKANGFDKEQEQYTFELNLLDEWNQVKGTCGSYVEHRIDCYLFDVNVRGVNLGRASGAQLTSVKNLATEDFEDPEYNSALNRSWAQGLYKIVDNGTLVSTMSGKHYSYYGQKGLQDKIFLMTAYLTQYNNRNSGVMSVPISKYNIPQFWDSPTLLNLGKKNAPKLSLDALVFNDAYVTDVLNKQAQGVGPYPGKSPGQVAAMFNDIKKRVIEEHKEEFYTDSEVALTHKLNKILDGFLSPKGSGKLGGLDALAYNNYVLDGNGPNRFYRLNNGGWVYRSNSPRKGINGGNSFSEPSLNDDGYYYYIYNKELNGWHELLMPAGGVSTTSDPYLAQAFWKGMKGVARYALPIEDAVILINGEDFDGNEASRAEAGIFLIIGNVPGGKILKPAFKVVKGAKALKIVTKQGAKTFITNLEKLAPLFRAGNNKSFFWSGKTNGVGGATRALEIAKSKGGTTLEGLIDSKNIQLPNWDLANPQSLEAWKEVSKLYANEAVGDVRAIIGKDLRPGSVWETVELPALKANKNVTRIFTIDPVTLKETLIFKR